MKKYILGAALSLGILISPAIVQQVHAAGLTSTQIQAILSLLSSFGADSTTIANVTTALSGATSTDRTIDVPDHAAEVCAQPPMPVCPEGRACIQSFPALTTYRNEEAAKAAGATILHKGRCTEAESPTPNPPRSCRPIDRNLGPGSTGEEVKILQTFLSGQGIPVEATGYFGKITANAVAQFQEKYREEVLSPAGLATSTGVVGSFTRAKIHKICPTPPPFTDGELSDLRRWNTPPMGVVVPLITSTTTATTTQNGGGGTAY